MTDTTDNVSVKSLEKGIKSGQPSIVEREIAPDHDRIDPEVAKYMSDTAIEIDEATNKRLRRLIDKRILLVMSATYFLQSLDKGTLTVSSIMGLPEDTGLEGQQYSWLTTCIYIAILIMEYPINWIIQKVPLAKFLALNVICWSIVLALHSVCHNFVSLVVVRTLLGIFEATCQPIFVLMSCMWYKRTEQAFIVTIWYMMNGFQLILGGLVAYGFTFIKPGGPIKAWQALFLTYGCLSFLWGITVLIITPDSPMRAKCFSEEDKKLMVERVRSNQTGLQNRKFRMDQFYDALKDPQIWGYGAIAFLTTLPQSGVGSFANIIITGFGFTPVQTQLLSMVLGAYIMFALLSSNYIAKKWGNTIYVMMIYCVPSVIGTVVLMTVENKNTATKAGLLFAYYFVLSFWGTATLSLSLLGRNVGGQTKKSVAVAVNFIFWATGNAIGPQVFQSKDAPRYFTGFAIHLACYALLFIIMITLRFHFIRENKKKEEYLKSIGAPLTQEAGLAQSFDDLTDRQNNYFRYTY